MVVMPSGDLAFYIGHLNPIFMDKERLFYLLQQYLGDNATPEETEELFAYIKLPESEETLRCVIEELWKPDKTL
jgi:hypothetical protein